jgi:hypothetical protein
MLERKIEKLGREADATVPFEDGCVVGSVDVLLSDCHKSKHAQKYN